MSISFSIVICALNEEKNIAQIIENTLGQEKVPDFILERIVVVSDGSTDRTSELVRSLIQRFPEILLIENTERKGKALSFNIGKQHVTSDWLVSIDADVKIEGRKAFYELFQTIHSHQEIGLIGWEPIPILESKNIVTLGSMNSYFLIKNIKKWLQGGHNFYSAHGRFLALSKGLYTTIDLPDVPGTDQYMFFSCLKHRLAFRHNQNIIVRYALPEKFRDYIKQNTRYGHALDHMKVIFGKDLVEKETRVPVSVKITAIIETFLCHPFCFAGWAAIYLMGKCYFLKEKWIEKKISTSKWEISISTKNKV